MNLTQESQQELVQLRQEEQQLNNEARRMRSLGYNREASAYTRKWSSIFQKIQEIEKLGISTNERKAVIQTIPSMFKISGTRDIAMTNVEAVGYVNKLNNYVKVSYSKGSEYLRNVRGCAGMAGKYDLDSIEIISKDLYDEITQGVREAGGYKHTTHFAGMSQTMVGGQIKEKQKEDYSGLRTL